MLNSKDVRIQIMTMIIKKKQMSIFTILKKFRHKIGDHELNEIIRTLIETKSCFLDARTGTLYWRQS